MVEVPSPWSGRIARMFRMKGDLVKVGAPLVEFAEGTKQDAGTWRSANSTPARSKLQ